MTEIALVWTLLLLVGTVALVVWLVGLLFPTNAAARGEPRRGAGPLGLVDEAHTAAEGSPDASDQEQGSS